MRKHSVRMAAAMVCAAFAGGFVAQVLFGCMTARVADAGGNEVMRARAFIVVDEAGRDQVILGSDSDCTGLVVKDGQAAPRLLIGMLPEDQFGLVINDAQWATQVALGAWTGTNHLDLYDGEERPRFTVGVNREAGNAGLSFYDPQKTQRLGIGIGPGGGGDFVMSNFVGKDIWRASWAMRDPDAPPAE